MREQSHDHSINKMKRIRGGETKSMKKKISSLLVFTLVLTLLVPAFAFAATNDYTGHKYESSIAKLVALGIVKGYTNGDVHPDATLTRAEFAKIVAYAGGYAKAAELLGGMSTGFKDVKADHWASGYIALAASKGYLKGYTDGTFRPDGKVKVSEVVTVVLRLLGYNDELPGPWPSDYIAQAAVLGLFDNVQVTANAYATRGETFALTDYATRGETFALIDAALNQELVVYNKDTGRFDKVDADANQAGVQTKTLLAASFSDMASGIVTETKAVYGSQLADNKIKIGSTVKELASDAVFQGFTDPQALLGHSVKYIELGGKIKLLIDDTKAESVVNGTIENASYLTSVYNGVYRVDLEGKDPYTLVDSPLFVRNYQPVAKAAIQKGDSATIILNSDGKAQAVIAKKFTADDFVVTSVSAATAASPARISFSNNTTVNLAKDVLVVRNGAKAAVSDLQKDDVVSYVTNPTTNEVILVDAVAKTITGKVTGKKTDGSTYTLVVDGKEYKTTSAIYASAAVASSYTFLIGHSDNIVKATLVTGDTAVVKGVLVANTQVNILDGNKVVPYRELTFLTLDGKTEKRTVLEDKNSKSFATGSYGEFTFSKNSDGKDVVTASFLNNVTDAAVPFSYNKDTKIATVNGVKYFVTDSTVAINVTDSVYTKWAVVNVADLDSKTGLTAEIMNTGFNLAVIFVKGATISQPAQTATPVYGIVTGKSASVDDQGNAKYFINVNVNGVVNSYELDNETVYNGVYVESVKGKLVSVTDSVYDGVRGVAGKYDNVDPAPITATQDQVKVDYANSNKVYFKVNNIEYALTSSSVIYVKKTDGSYVIGVYDDLGSLTGYKKTYSLIAGDITVKGTSGTAQVVKAVLVELTAN